MLFFCYKKIKGFSKPLFSAVVPTIKVIDNIGEKLYEIFSKKMEKSYVCNPFSHLKVMICLECVTTKLVACE